jgi:hypothetical protein
MLVNGVSFNHSRDLFTVAHEQGFSVYRVDPFEPLCRRELGAGLALA